MLASYGFRLLTACLEYQMNACEEVLCVQFSTFFKFHLDISLQFLLTILRLKGEKGFRFIV